MRLFLSSLKNSSGEVYVTYFSLPTNYELYKSLNDSWLHIWSTKRYSKARHLPKEVSLLNREVSVRTNETTLLSDEIPPNVSFPIIQIYKILKFRMNLSYESWQLKLQPHELILLAINETLFEQKILALNKL